MAKYENLVPRFLKYVKTETRSDENSQTTPSTQTQVEFAQVLKKELLDLGMSDVKYNDKNGYLTALLPATTDKKVKTIGFLAHMDTADFNAKNVNPQIIEGYDGTSIIKLDKAGEFVLDPAEFPNLKGYKGQTLITTDGTTLLGADDKSGIAEIMSAMEYLIAHPEIKHGDIKVGFGPDEEIGTGADKFDVKDFACDYAYTMDGGPVGELEYETFNAADVKVHIKGKNVHPGTAKGIMVNALQLAVNFQDALPQSEVPEKTEGREGFFHLLWIEGEVESAEMEYIIRDHDRQKFEARKALIQEVADKMNEELGMERITLTVKNEYFNMREVIEKDMAIVDLAEKAMLDLNIKPIIEPVRGGTDGSKISFMGLPTPNIFAGGENMHGRFEYVAVESMEKAADVIIRIAELNAE